MKSLLLRGALCASMAVFLLGAPQLHAATSVEFTAGTLEIFSDAADALVVDCAAGNVRLNGIPVAGPVACAAVANVQATGGPDSNLIDLSGMLSEDFVGMLASTLIGGAGADTLVGSFADDEMTWNPGDGSDSNDGGPGNDRVEVNGSDTPNTFSVGTAGAAAGFDLRFVGPFTIDIVRAEVLEVNGRGDNDSISASALPAGLIALEITGGTGNDTIVGSAGDDTNIWNNGDNTDTFDGGSGNDLQIVNGAGVGDIFTVLAAAGAPIPNSVLFRRSNLIPFDVTMGNTELLRVNGLAGDDSISASALPAGLIALEITGGTGNDTIVGSAGDDTNIWNNGDNTDTFDGGSGNDLQIVNGAGVGDIFTVLAAAGAPIPNSVLFRRSNLVPFDVTMGNTELLRVNGLAGDDSISASALPAGLIALEITGGTGNDTIVGSAGDDTNIWNNGDNTDTFDGGSGNDLQIVNGAGVGDIFTVLAAAGAPIPNSVLFRRSNLIPFDVTMGNTERLRVNGLAGDDSISASALPAGLIALEITGGTGNDTIVGSAGDDTNIWNNGDNTDTFDGGSGNDLQIVNGAGVGDIFTVLAAAGAPIPNSVLFRRSNLIPFDVTMGNTERLRVNGLAGDDSISASALPAGLIALEITGGTGNDTIVGSAGDDTNIWNNGDNTDTFDGGSGNDLQIVNGAGVGDIFTVLAAAGAPIPNSVLFRRSNLIPFDVTMGNTERLRVNGLGGDDSISASALPAGLISLELDGGDGSDAITGSAGNDTLRGGLGSDTMIGFLGADHVLGDGGDDLMTWNPGDGSDFNDGGEGNDISRVLAAGVAENFTIAPLDCGGNACVRIRRILPTFFDVDVLRVEQLELETGGGRDTVSTQPLPGVMQLLDGGSPDLGGVGVDFFPVDGLQVAGISDPRASPVEVAGFGDIHHANFEFAPTMVLAALNREAGHTAELTGAQEVPPVNTTASARGSVVLNADQTQITVRLSFSGLSSANTMSHIHGPALPGVNAGVIFDLGNSGSTSGELGPLQFAVNAAQVAQLKNGLWYFNVHSVNHGSGEVRGQIRPDRVFEAYLQPQQVVGDTVISAATGFGTITLAGTEDSVVVTLSYAGLTGEGVAGVSTGVRLRGPAPRGANGAALNDFPLRVSSTANDQFITQEYPITAQEVADLKARRWYFEVQSQEFPDGELRGQVDNLLFCSGFEATGCR